MNQLATLPSRALAAVDFACILPFRDAARMR